MNESPTWLIANWKMNGDAARVAEYAAAIAAALAGAPAHIVGVFCPPALYLPAARAALPTGGALKLGAQNCHDAIKGAHTGEISAGMLVDAGCSYVILGHSERRAAGETDAHVTEKTRAALAAGLIPVVCVGESDADYGAGRTEAVLAKQLAALQEFAGSAMLIAYEPIWAIGTGKTPTIVEIAAVHHYIKSALGSAQPVLYGGSVNPGNIAQIVQLPEVSGSLIGGASLEISSMSAIIAACMN